MSARCMSGDHDSVSFSVSSLYAWLQKCDLPAGFWYAAGEVYVCEENMLTPVAASKCDPESPEEVFNFSFLLCVCT